MLTLLHHMAPPTTAFAASSDALTLASTRPIAPGENNVDVAEIRELIETQYQPRIWSQLMHRFKPTHTDKDQALDSLVNQAIADALPHAAVSITFFINNPNYSFDDRFQLTRNVLDQIPGSYSGEAFIAYQAFLGEWGAYII